jgi:hypothetical protein
MHNEYPTIESRATGGHTAIDPDECQRRLGGVYRLILSYEPKEKAATQDEVGEAPLPRDTVQAAIG